MAGPGAKAPHISLLEGDVGAHLRRMALPLTWGLMAMTLFRLADTYFISRLGTRYLAAIGFCIPVIMLFMGIIFGLSVGTSSVLSRIYGEGEMEKMRRTATDALSLAVLAIGVSCVAGFLGHSWIFRQMGATPDLMPLIHKYMSIWYVGLPFLGMMIVGNACIRATGDTAFVSRMMSLLALINIVLDPFFIFGWGPFPELKMAGAAVTHVVANYITSMILLYELIFRRGILAPKIFHRGIFDSWKRILHIAGPSVLSNQIAPISAVIITWLAAGFGKEAVAALGVASRVEVLSVMAFYATGASVSIFTGQNFGAGNYGRIREAMETGARYAILWGLFVAVVLWAFAERIPLVFDKNPLVAAYTAQYLYWVPVSYGAMGTMVICNAALNAMGRPLPATTLILLKAVVIYLPLAFIGQAYMGFTGILAALVATNMAVGLISYVVNRSLVPS
ncbi:MAG: MATE family efflux transporter [Alphaproteobacteria bacterium]|nr:MATE family efflux transporter [Alphaproteobacteria bacterium]